MSSRARILVLFDVDGTLTPARRDIEAPMIAALAKLRSKVFVGVVGGSDFPKQQEQLGEKCLDHFDCKREQAPIYDRYR
jgi:phosphomannomutase